LTSGSAKKFFAEIGSMKPLHLGSISSVTVQSVVCRPQRRSYLGQGAARFDLHAIVALSGSFVATQATLGEHSPDLQVHLALSGERESI
jgi:hypothetical protein